jgi:GT2 family glycosyltransferase
MEELLRLMEEGKWEEALHVVLGMIKEKKDYTSELMILAATILEHFGDEKGARKYIEQGLRIDPKNYELYFMLGNQLVNSNPNQAFLSYENALFYCTQPEDQVVIQEAMDALEKEQIISVAPASIVILSYNQRELTQKCLESIRATCPKSAYEIVVVDNASEDDSVEYLRQQSDIILIENKENEGFPRGCNIGARKSAKDNDIFLLNNDTELFDNSLFMLRMGLYESPENGAAGACSNYVSNLQQIVKPFDSIEQWKEFARTLQIPEEKTLEDKPYLVGFALLIRRSIWDKVGELDERFTPGNFEDNDYGFRVMESGYHNVLCHNCFIYHKGSSAFGKRKDFGSLLQNNQQKMNAKWGFDVGYSLYPREEVLDMIQDDKEAEIHVLDVGCALGATIRRLKYRWPNAEVHGIEIRDDVASLGGSNFPIIAGDASTMELPWPTEYFDYIILADVVEHIAYPEPMLERLRGYLKEGGQLLVSLPNVMHYSVLQSYLLGHWTYEDAGILDRTHMRFYTAESANRLFTSLRYEVKQILPLTLKGEDVLPFVKELIEREETCEDIQFYAYQYLLRCVKNEANS